MSSGLAACGPAAESEDSRPANTGSWNAAVSIDINAPLPGMPAGATPMIRDNLRVAAEQYRTLLAKLDSIPDGQNDIPRSLKPDGSLNLVAPSDWTSGFFPGSLWMLFEVTRDPMWRTRAQEYTTKLKEIRKVTSDHDTGFMMYCSYGNGMRLLPDTNYRDVLVETSNSLSTRFNMHSKSSGGQRTATGLIRSWDWGPWSYPVIIDNLMNLEMLFWASRKTGDAKYRNIAVSHLDQTLRNHFRPDASSYHLVDYNNDGTAKSRVTYQGLNDSSAWARGQGWALYGYTMAYRETSDPKYLDHARRVASFILSHPGMPADKVPLWDFDAPTDQTRDSSAAALYASALYELSTLVSDGAQYEAAADAILASLSSPAYQARSGEASGFLLKHGAGNVPKPDEVDVPLNYGDYYYLEANLRKLRILEARTLYDRLSDMSKLRETSANWVVDSSNPAYFAGDTGRLKRTNGKDPEHIVWAHDGLGSFTVTVYYYKQLDGDLKVSASSDGSSYTELPVRQSPVVDTAGDWHRVELTSAGPLPTGLRRFRIQMKGGLNVYSPQISAVVLGPR
jgi:hypothetical protein